MKQISRISNPSLLQQGNLKTTWVMLLLASISLGIFSSAPVQAAPQMMAAATGQPITTSSGAAEIAIANHLNKVGAKMYGAYWCSHCQNQKQLFGKEAWPKISYVECAADGQNANLAACKQAKIEGYPTWLINGRQYPGTMSMFKLARASGYKGPTNFRNVTPR
jgi:protein-disulfide isomerase